jgi:hypothetical protein
MNLKYIIQTIMFGAALFAGVHCAAHEGTVSVHPDARSVEHVLKAQFDKPEAPLSVAPVSVEGNYAVAGWLQGARGGRALLLAASGDVGCSGSVIGSEDRASGGSTHGGAAQAVVILCWGDEA